MRLLIAGCFLMAALLSGVTTGAQAQCEEELVVQGGLDDNFEGLPEDTEPSPELTAFTQAYWPQYTYRHFDEDLVNVALIHTFSGWEGEVCGATLEMRLKTGTASMSTNDTVRLGLLGGEDPFAAFRYWATIGLILGSWGPLQEGMVVLDLANLPEKPSYPTDILADLSDGRLELLVEDDTAVDFARLTICPCAAVPVETTTWGALKARY